MSLAITTSDGAVVVGESLDGERAAAEYAQLEMFTHFLEARLVTQQLPLLRALFAEYFCRRATILQQFIHQGAIQIAIVPIAIEGADEELPSVHLPVSAGSKALVYLSERVCTTQFSTLTKIYEEYCHGDDTTLRDYSKNGVQVISLLPLASTDEKTTSSELEFRSEEQQPMPPPPPRRSQIGRRSTGGDDVRYTTTSSSEPGSEDSDGGGDSADRCDADVHTQLTEYIARVEADEPWLIVFEGLPLPPGVDQHPELAGLLRAFWATHGRAVWERNFWIRLQGDAYQERHHRQELARKAFETIMIQCFQRLGARFFHVLERKGRRHPGWWYWSRIVELGKLAEHLGLEKVIADVEAQKLERFPVYDLSLRMKNSNERVINKRVSAACWANTTHPGVLTMKRHVASYLAKKTRRAEAKRKSS